MKERLFTMKLNLMMQFYSIKNRIETFWQIKYHLFFKRKEVRIKCKQEFQPLSHCATISLNFIRQLYLNSD